jgi:ribose 5-phosphate isomerase
LAIPGLDAGIQQNLKRAVAKKAVELVKSGMIVGLGTGSTSSMAIEELGKLIAQNKVQSTQFYSFLVAYKILPQLDLLGNIA